ncbi:MAG TPA: hypothetical protein VFC25_11115 [Verrucomicrobiae bacterium]|nr:hypothetical protein [Verrucomicrobiae bacterium]
MRRFYPRTAAFAAAFMVTTGVASASAAGPSAADRWTFFWHGYAYLDSNRQGGDSGARVFESINHFMAGGDRPLGAWRMGLRGMFSLEPATVPLEGSPLLFQRGETYQGNLLIDRQHAHDLFVQLQIEFERPLPKGSRLLLSAALRGEPAVGPVAFPHRLSSSAIPMAPLSHHNLDSTHISDDVVTALWGTRFVTVDTSLFHGAEPDENRWDLDQGALDSYAGRITVNPGTGLSFQVSACRREEPEAIEAGNQTRQTASISWQKGLGSDGSFGVLAASGRNLLPEDQEEWGHIAEATVHFRSRHDVYGRIEQVDRDLYELTNKIQRPETVEPARTHVEELTLGYAYTLPLLREAKTSAGVAVAGYRFDERLDDVYGERPISLWVYLRFGFGSAAAMPGHEHHH